MSIKELVKSYLDKSVQHGYFDPTNMMFRLHCLDKINDVDDLTELEGILTVRKNSELETNSNNFGVKEYSGSICVYSYHLLQIEGISIKELLYKSTTSSFNLLKRELFKALEPWSKEYHGIYFIDDNSAYIRFPRKNMVINSFRKSYIDVNL